MDLKSLQIFLSVNSSLSFTRTASEQHLSISAVSRCIHRLEEELGERLFDRDRRGMTATSAARRLQTVAERMLSDWRSLQQSLGDDERLQGELRIFCSVTATHRLLSPLLAAYREAFPRVQILLQTGDQADGFERVRRGSSDVAVIARPESQGESYAFAPLANTPMCLCLPLVDCALSDALQGRSEKELWTVLGDLPWVLPARGVSKDLIDQWLRGRFSRQPVVYARVAGHEAIVAMVSLGLGVAVLPRLVVEASGLENSLRVIDLGNELPEFEISLCARQPRLTDPVIQGLWKVAEGLEHSSDRIKGQ
ncbi:HTH-type transcriptional activator IlvY [Congregibacter litoralis]|uniref:Transcriptional regulator n=1 Tax=Congregibacter litoralis KT71 TaxID=314285 RepID=A4ADS8_9GAMM|nr:HTH-type transcriptional activator IlvY [Congregibacter litoralis]EAQ95810.1 Transcriptional regulator [Congregibacter litoralis KT71]